MTDTDANAVLCRIASPVLGSYRENDSRFWCYSRSEIWLQFALCWSVIHNLYQWQTFDLDHVLCEGNSNYKQLNTLNLLAADELPNVVQTADDHRFSVEMLIQKSSRFSEACVMDLLRKALDFWCLFQASRLQ